MADVALTERELEILNRMSLGFTNIEIGTALWVAPDTVKSHAARIFRKLAVNDRAHAVRRGIELGLLAVDIKTTTAKPAPEPPVSELSKPTPRAHSAVHRDRHIAACFAAEACPCRAKQQAVNA